MDGIEINNIQEMTSNQIAEFTGKRHSDVIRDIRNMEKNLHYANLRRLWKSSSYVDKKGVKRDNYTFSKKGSLLFASQYDVNINLALIERWEQLEIREKLRSREENEYLRAQARRLYWEANPDDYEFYLLSKEREL